MRAKGIHTEKRRAGTRARNGGVEKRRTRAPMPPAVPLTLGSALARVTLPLLLTLAFMVTVVPTAFLLESPGPAFDLQGDLELEGAESYDSAGDFMLTSVSISESNLLNLAISCFSDGMDTLKISDYLGEELNIEEQDMVDTVITYVSQDTATVEGLREAGLPVEVTELGVLVVAVAEGYPAQGAVRPGDVIVAVDGEKVTDGERLNALINAAPEGEGVTLSLKTLDKDKVREMDEEASNGESASHDLASLLVDEVREVEVIPVYEPELERRIIGVSIREYFTYTSDVKVTWDLETVKGPSAGLMMTLSLVNALTPDDLTGGRKIAGTGEIALDGRVGPIGGLPMKIRAAEREGAEVFLYPEANRDDLEGVSTGMELHAVSTLKEAIDFLRSRASR